MQPPASILDLPKDAAEYDRMIEPLAEAVQRCRSDDESGLIDHLDGLSQALDVEAMRLALGEDRVNFTAQSYGGVVVTTYARHFPERVRTAYVDGTLSHPDYPIVTGSSVQRRNFARFANWCETTPECALYGVDIQQLWNDVTEEANRSPVPATSERHGNVELSGAQLHFLTRAWSDPGPEHENWLQLAVDIDRVRQGDASPFVDWAFGNLAAWSMPSSIAMHCSDGSQGRADYQHFRDVVDRYQQGEPLRYAGALLGMACGAWPLPIANPPAPLPSENLPPFLGAGTTDNDFAPTQQLLEHIPGSVTIAVDGTGHVVYLPGLSGPANKCVLDHLSRYLIDLELPPEGTACEPSTAPTAQAR